MENVIVVKDVRVHTSTGYIEVDIVAVRQSGKSTVGGPMKTYGIDAHEIQAQYGGQVNLWLNAVKGKHIEHSGHYEEIVDQLLAMKGKEL